MKKILYQLTLLILLVTACGKKEDAMTNEEKIAGEDVKTWKATREEDKNGDKEKLTKEEKHETITFLRNGNVTMKGGENQNDMLQGKWTYADNLLSIQFKGTNKTENFTVLELDRNKMRLKAGDGSELTMKPE